MSLIAHHINELCTLFSLSLFVCFSFQNGNCPILLKRVCCVSKTCPIILGTRLDLSVCLLMLLVLLDGLMLAIRLDISFLEVELDAKIIIDLVNY